MDNNVKECPMCHSADCCLLQQGGRTFRNRIIHWLVEPIRPWTDWGQPQEYIPDTGLDMIGIILFALFMCGMFVFMIIVGG